jgi:hypothetical protein
MSRKPPNHGTYQIWHGGKVHAVDVESVNEFEVDRLTRRPPAKWKDNPAVKLHIDNPRSTRLGDVIVDPTCGAWEVQKDGYLAVQPPAPVAERMEREGIVPQHIQLLKEWTEDMLAAIEAQERTVADQKPSDRAKYAQWQSAESQGKKGPVR